MQKAALRRLTLQKRRSYRPEEVAIHSQQICRRFFDYFAVNRLQVIHSFLPITSNNEVNTWFIIEHLRTYFPEISLAVPVMDSTNQSLAHYLLTPGTKLSTNSWGILEPHNAEATSVAAIDMVLVPLLAFDQKGHRVGYGKGYYDRFLAACCPDTLTVGLSLEAEPVPTISDVHEGDIHLQFVVTPTRVYQFN